MGLVITAMATLGIAAWLSLLSARGAYIEGIEVSANHRVAKMNANAAVEEFLYRNYLTKSSTIGTTITLPDNSATISIPASNLPPLGSYSLPGGVVTTGMANGYGYHVELPVSNTIKVDHDNDPSTTPLDSTYTRNYLLKSRAPQLAGDLMVMHKPTITSGVDDDLDGYIRIYGNTVLWAAEWPHTVDSNVRSERYITYTPATPTGADKIKDLSGNWVPPTNYALMPTTGGDYGSSNGYSGTLNVVDPGATATWSMKNYVLGNSHIALSGDVAFDSGRGAKSDGNGNIDITLGDIHLTNVLISDHVDTINLRGQTDDASFADAGLRGAIMIVYVQTGSSTDELSHLNLYGRNNRRVSLGLKREDYNADEVHMAFRNANTNPSWRLILTSENMRIREAHTPDGTVTMFGGIRTDRDFRWDIYGSKILEIHKETDPKLLERLVPRTAWLESYAG
jgi:hypothetical protein